MSALTPQLRAPCASRGSVRSVSSLDCGAAEPRQAYGGAAFSRKRPACGRERIARDLEIVRLHEEGATQARLARRFNLSQASVCGIVGAGYDEVLAARRRRVESQDARRSEFLKLYEAGLSLEEIAARAEISRPRVARVLKRHPDYEPRCPYPRYGRKAEVPAWVPQHHAVRYRRIAASDGEEIAASCLRKLKRLEAQSA